MKRLRKKIWIDRFQTHLVVRIAAYCLLYQMATWVFVGLEQSVFAALDGVLGRQAASACLLFAAVSVVLLGFLFICDAARFAHRIVGPLFRLRKTIQAINAGEEIQLVNLRKDDYLHDLKDEFNAMLKLLEQRGAIVIKTPETAAQEKRAVAA